jgi:predicted RNA-binding Zn ribbon-like protein
VEFNSHTDKVVRATVGLVNLLTPGSSRGRGYLPPEDDARTAAVSSVLRSAGGRQEVSWEEAASLCFVAAELRDVFEAVDSGAVDEAARLVNAMLIRTGARPELERHDGEPWHLHFHSADNTLVNGWAAGCATGLAVVLGGEMHDRLGVCFAPHCDRVYVDTSRNGTRRFCSTSCQNRVKTAAFRARMSLSVPGSGGAHWKGVRFPAFGVMPCSSGSAPRRGGSWSSPRKKHACLTTATSGPSTSCSA